MSCMVGDSRLRIAVLGAGAWGTALAASFAGRQIVTLWARDAESVNAMATGRENARYLPGIPLPESLQITADFQAAVRSADLALAVVPVSGLREVARAVSAVNADLPLVAACKGLEADSGLLAHQVVEAERGSGAPYGVLSGPSFAQEVAHGLPAALTLASSNEVFARATALHLHSARLRIYSSTDVAGVEIGGAVKNILAIAAGISDGLGFGYNARAALITRGLAEVTRLAMALGGQPETLMGLAGMGDLILTSTGDLSRNRQVGLRLAGGESLAAILSSLGHVAEGVNTVAAVDALAAQLGVDMPITRAVRRIIHGGESVRAVVEDVLGRVPGTEFR